MPNRFLFYLFEDRIGREIQEQTKIFNRWVKREKVVYSVEKEIDVRTLQIKYKRPIRYTETPYYRLVTVYDKTLTAIPFRAVQGNKIVFGVGLDGLITVPLNEEMNSILITGCSGSGKSCMAKSVITNLILSEVETWIIDNKKSHDYDVFKKYLPLYKGIDQFPKFLGRVSVELDKRLSKKHNEPLVVVIDEVFALKLLQQGKLIYDQLAVILSTCRGGNMHFIIISQRSTTSVLPSEITTHISIRVALQQSTKQESQNVIYCDDAYYITSKGRGYLSLNGKLKELCSFYLTDHEIKKLLPPPPQTDKISTDKHGSIKKEIKYVKNYIIGGDLDGSYREGQTNV